MEPRRRPRLRRPPARPGPARDDAAAARLNPPDVAPMVLERVILHRHLAALGLPVPRLHGVVGGAGGYCAAGGRPLPDIDATITFLATGVPDRFVVRPSAADHPAPTRALTRDGDEVLDRTGARTPVAQLAAELLAEPGGMYLVQERLRNHPDWGTGGGLTPLRLTTLVRASGEADVFTAGPPRRSPPPGWAEATAAVRRAAAHLMPLRCLAWTVAITADGPRLLGARPQDLPPVLARPAHGAVVRVPMPVSHRELERERA